jgi:hypothetical protein
MALTNYSQSNWIKNYTVPYSENQLTDAKSSPDLPFHQKHLVLKIKKAAGQSPATFGGGLKPDQDRTNL